MRQPAVRQTQQRKSRSASIPAPVGGWNARDPLAAMDAMDAVIMENFFPRTTDVTLRKGFTNYSDGMTGDVETLITYNKADGTNKIFACVGGNIYDVTVGGTVGAAVVTGKSSARWQHVNFATTGGKFLILVNGVDNMLLYDGTTWTVITGVSVPAITGINTNLFINVCVFKRRLWFVERDSLSVWYLPIDSIAGAALEFDLSPLFDRGGYLVAMGNWTLDAGVGMDDQAVFINSVGQIAVYQGTDPNSSTTWSLIGVYQVGTPIGYRCLVKFQSELLIICRDGLLTMVKALTSDKMGNKSALTDKIQQAMTQAAALYGQNFGWQVQLFYAQNMLILNVPTTATVNEQYVMNTITGAWCRFTGWDAICWTIAGEEIYFGATDKVCKAWSGNTDGDSNVFADCLQAFNSFGAKAQNKHFKLTRPVISVSGANLSSFGLKVALNTEFDLSPPTSWPNFTPVTGALWDSAIWDNALWVSDYDKPKQDWLTVPAIGYQVAMHIRVVNRVADLSWWNTDFIFEVGSGL